MGTERTFLIFTCEYTGVPESEFRGTRPDPGERGTDGTYSGRTPGPQVTERFCVYVVTFGVSSDATGWQGVREGRHSCRDVTSQGRGGPGRGFGVLSHSSTVPSVSTREVGVSPLGVRQYLSSIFLPFLQCVAVSPRYRESTPGPSWTFQRALVDDNVPVPLPQVYTWRGCLDSSAPKLLCVYVCTGPRTAGHGRVYGSYQGSFRGRPFVDSARGLIRPVPHPREGRRRTQSVALRSNWIPSEVVVL